MENISMNPATSIPSSVFGTPTAVGTTFMTSTMTTSPTSIATPSGSFPSAEGHFLGGRMVAISGYFAAIAWGVLLTITYRVGKTIIENKNRTNLTWIPILAGLFLSATVSMGGFVAFNESGWALYRDYAGAPQYHIMTQLENTGVFVAALAASLVTQLLCQGFLVYRLHALYSRLALTILAALWATANLGLSLLSCILLSFSDIGFTNPYESDGLAFAVFVWTSMPFNFLLSILLLSRVLYFAPRVPTSFPEHIRKRYVRMDALLVESATPLGVVSFVFFLLSVTGSSGANLCYPLLIQLEAITPILIIGRIIDGFGWDVATVHMVPMNPDNWHARPTGLVPATADGFMKDGDTLSVDHKEGMKEAV